MSKSPPLYEPPNGGDERYNRAGDPFQQSGSPYGQTQPPKPVPLISPYVPIVTYVLLGITVVLFFFQQAELFFGLRLPFLLDIKNNALIAQGQFWRLFTPMFLHGSILHLAFNMYALSIIGPVLERYMGRWRFLLLYIISGFAGNVLSFLLTPSPSLGASTAIFGMIGAQGVFIYQNRQLFAGRARGALNQILMIAVINLLIGLSPGIDNWGHIGGLIGGVAFTWFAGPLFSPIDLHIGQRFSDLRTPNRVVMVALVVMGVFVLLAALGVFRYTS